MLFSYLVRLFCSETLLQINAQDLFTFLLPSLDFDQDGHIGIDDLKNMLDHYTGKEEEQKLSDEHKEKLIEEVNQLEAFTIVKMYHLLKIIVTSWSS